MLTGSLFPVQPAASQLVQQRINVHPPIHLAGGQRMSGSLVVRFSDPGPCCLGVSLSTTKDSPLYERLCEAFKAFEYDIPVRGRQGSVDSMNLKWRLENLVVDDIDILRPYNMQFR